MTFASTGLAVLTLTRGFQDGRATLGMLRIEGREHDPIFTLENPYREGGVDSCIPTGAYLCTSYSSPKFRDVYLVRDVPGRTAILFHAGNTAADTEGCILLGMQAMTSKGQPAVLQSKVALEYLRSIIGKNATFRLVVK